MRGFRSGEESSSSTDYSCAPSFTTIHSQVRPVGSIEAAECTTWSAMDIDDWARPSRRPIFDTARNTNYGTRAHVVERDRSTARGRLQNVERHTSQALASMGTHARYVRCNGHMLDQAISRPVCSAHHSPPWAVRRVSKLCPEEIKDVAWWRNGGMPSSQRLMGVRPRPGLGAQRVWLSPGAPLASGSVTIATTLLLSRGLLGMRW